MSNKINTTTGNEVKDMNTAELEGKASSSTSQSGEMPSIAKLLVITIGLFSVMGLVTTGYGVLVYYGPAYTLNRYFYLGLALLFMAAALCIFLQAIVNKWKKETETSTEEQTAEVAKTEEATDVEDEKPSNPFSNAVKFLLIGLGLIVTSALIGFGFALLH